MSNICDFRTLIFTPNNVKKSGISVGRSSYWKLYTIENYYRVIIHSILSAQLNTTDTDWWDFVKDEELQKKINIFKKAYISRPWHTNPGTHDIYYIDLKDLNNIAMKTINVLERVITDFEKFIINIETIRLPRNIVAHMNFPNKDDQKRIDALYQNMEKIMDSLSKNQKICILIP